MQIQAQSPYTLSTSNVDYQKLSSGISINGGTIWSVQKFPIPLPFSFKMGSITTTEMYIDGAILYPDTMNANVGIFQYFSVMSIDRGALGSSSKSPLRYQVTGNPGSRIFKIESLSQGFYYEYLTYGTLADSFNCQFWLYEGSNIVEIHFGEAKISHAGLYFVPIPDTAPSYCGYQNMDFTTGNVNYAYVAAGNPLNAVLDSLTATHTPLSFTSYPPSGTVYRFTPKNLTAIDDNTTSIPVQIYPTQINDYLTIDYSASQKATYHFLNIQGEKLNINGQLQTGINQLVLTPLPQGIYLLQIITPTALSTHKIIKI